MNHARPFRMLVGGLAAALTLGTVGISAAEARPIKPGPVTNLTASAATSGVTSGSYLVTATWDGVTNASGYRASITRAGTVLASKTVSSPAWSLPLATSAGAATLTVKAVIGHRQSRARSVSFQLTPDTTAPHGSYSTTWDNTTGLASITQDSLTDDSAVDLVTRTVNWHDGSPSEPWTATTPLPHTYPLTPAQEVTFQPTVTLTDVWGNSRDVDAAPIVFNDLVAPAGSFSRTNSGTTWAKLTKVTISQSSLSDNRTSLADIARSVDWGDGSSVKTWTNGTTISHVYASGDTFYPVVKAEDQAHNVATFPLSAVTVTVDAVAPVVRLLLPRTHRHSVKAWRLLGGKATDTAGTGVKRVSLRAVEKRGTKWFGYRPATKTWVKAATKAAAFRKGRAFSLTTNLRHRWSAHLAGLRKGTLVYKVSAVDRVLNASRPLIHKVTLTKP